MHPLNVALPGPYVSEQVTRGALAADGIFMRRLAAEPRSITGLLFSSQCPLERLADPVFDGVGLSGFKSWAKAFVLAYAALSLL